MLKNIDSKRYFLNLMSEKNRKKLLNFQSRLQKRILVVGIIFTLTAGFIFRDAFNEYEARIQMVAASKNAELSDQMEAVSENLIEFPKTLAFYERLLKNNPNIQDGFEDLSARERKKLWNDQIETSGRIVNNRAWLSLSVFSRKAANADALSEKVADSLIEVMGNFYDTDKDLALAVVEGPIVYSVNRHWIKVGLLSILIGFLASLILNLILEGWEKQNRESKSFFQKSLLNLQEKIIAKNSLSQNMVATTDVPYSFDDRQKAEEKNIQTDENYFADKKIADQGKSAAAPDNLPIFEEIPGLTFQTEPIVEKQENIEIEKEENITPIKEESEIEKLETKEDVMEMPNFQSEETFGLPDNLPTAPDSLLGNLPVAEVEEKEEKEPDFIEMKDNEPTAQEMKDRLNKLLRGDLP